MVRAAAVVRVAVEDRVVEVEDQAPGPPAELAELPAGQELALEDDGVELARPGRTGRGGARGPVASGSIVSDHPEAASVASNARTR